MINSEYLNNLNNAQKEAVLHLNGPLLIVAGAGSGKTRVLTSRIAHIINEKKAFPNQILSVTFTNKAAKEMQNRVSSILNSEAIGLTWLGTFHSILHFFSSFISECYRQYLIGECLLFFNDMRNS